MSKSTILAIDQGTTSSRAILFAQNGMALHTSQKELTLHYPHAGWVEQDPEEIWQDTLSACHAVLNTEEGAGCAAIGITNQRETTIIWNRKTDVAIYNAIVWQDRRTADICTTLKPHEPMLSQKTGLLMDPYFSCTKIKWILDNVDGARDMAMRGDLAFGTIDTFLLWRLTGGDVHVTDATNASRTGLFNIRTQDWDDELLVLFDIPRSILPTVKDSADDFGTTAPDILPRQIPITGMAGDQHAALIGQACFDVGMIKSTYGTGCFALMNIGEDFKPSKNRLLTTMAYRLNGVPTYAIEGSIFMAGAVVQWLRDNLGIIDDATDSEALANTVPDNGGVYLVPAFTGLGAPHWRPDARAIISGLGRESTKAHIVRAALEAQAYQTYDLLSAMENDTGVRINTVRVDGGLANNEFVCQFLADILRVDIERPTTTETTALGAAYLAGLYIGLYADLDDIAMRWARDKSFVPDMDQSTVDHLYDGWQTALSKALEN